MPGQIRLTEITTELLTLRNEYADLQVDAVSRNTTVYEHAVAATEAIDALIATHENLVQEHRRWVRNDR